MGESPPSTQPLGGTGGGLGELSERELWGDDLVRSSSRAREALPFFILWELWPRGGGYPPDSLGAEDEGRRGT